MYYSKKVIHSVSPQFIIPQLNRNRLENQKDNNIISDLQRLVLCRFFQSDFISLLLGTVHPKIISVTIYLRIIRYISCSFGTIFGTPTVRFKEKSSMNIVQNFSRTEVSQLHGCGTMQVWENYDRLFIFEWTAPFNTLVHTADCANINICDRIKTNVQLYRTNSGRKIRCQDTERERDTEHAEKI